MVLDHIQTAVHQAFTQLAIQPAILHVLVETIAGGWAEVLQVPTIFIGVNAIAGMTANQPRGGPPAGMLFFM